METSWNTYRQKERGYYRRQAENTPLYRLIYHHRDALERNWESCFEHSYGFLRQSVLEAFDEYLNCGIILHGCARLHCEHCNHSELLAFSCKRRGLCPSCDAKRALLFAEHLEHEVLLPCPHRHLVFTIPKRLRVYFKFNRKLHSVLYKSAWTAWKRYINNHLPGSTGMVMALHTAGEELKFHPHVHAIALNGAIDDNGTFAQLSSLDTTILESPVVSHVELYFQQEVFNQLIAANVIEEEVAVEMATWEHSGFSAWVSEPIEPTHTEHRLFLSRYLKKAVISNQRLSIDDSNPLATTVTYRSGKTEQVLSYGFQPGSLVPDITHHTISADTEKQFSPLEFLATLTLHIPDKWEQTTRYYGIYAARTRGKKRQLELEALEQAILLAEDTNQDFTIPLPPFREEPTPKPSKTWAACMKRVFEVDPLVCPKCGSQMKIKAFITDSKEIIRLCHNLGIAPPGVSYVELWRAPPKFSSQKASTNTVVEPFFDGWQSSSRHSSKITH